MSVSSMFSAFASLHANPIIEAEFRHQRFVIRNSHSGAIWIALAAALVVPSLLLALASTGAVLVQPLLPDVPLVASLLQTWVLVPIVVVNAALYPVVTLITFGLASNSILREKRNRTWDNLRLTDISATRIVIGKWWASLKVLNGDQAMVGLARLGLVTWLLILAHEDARLYVDALPMIPLTLLLSALTFVYTVLDAALSAALAIAAALPERPGMPVQTTLAFGLRAVVTLAGFGWLVFTLYGLFEGGPFQWGWLLLSSFIGVGAYLVFIFGALWAARQWVQ